MRILFVCLLNKQFGWCSSPFWKFGPVLFRLSWPTTIDTLILLQALYFFKTAYIIHVRLHVERFLLSPFLGTG